MSYKKLRFKGDTKRWFSEIMNAEEHLLLNGSEHGKQFLPDSADHRLIGLFTSATTGHAKCICNSFEKLLLNALISAREFEISSGDRLLMMAKPWHVAGLSWGLMGETLDLDYTFIPTKRWEANRWYKAIQEIEPDYLLTVPAVLRSLFNFGDWFVPNIVFGGTPIAYEDYEPLSRHTQTMYQGYGQTEAGGLISCHKIESSESIDPQMQYRYGAPPKEFEVRCDGSAEEPKTILLKSPSSIYDDFYDTGDVGFMEKGRLFLAGRNQSE